MCNPNYTLKRKARYVVCGYSQIQGVDYNETYAPTTLAVLTTLHIISMMKYNLGTFDVSAAFLEGTADCKMYARLPSSIATGKDLNLRVEIVGNWYGMKQGPKIWNDQLNSIMLKLDFTRCPVHPCIYMKIINGIYLIIVVHVDDGLMGCNDAHEFDIFIVQFQQHVRKATVTRDIKKFTGININYNQSEGVAQISHEVYIESKFSKFIKPSVTTPMLNTTNLRTAEPNNNNDSLLSDTGTFRFICDRARPDILVAVGESFTGGDKNPSDLHVKTSERIKQYLHNTKDMYIRLGSPGKLCLFGYSDASYIIDGNAKRRLGGCVFLNHDSGAIHSYSVNNTIASHSAMESEIKAIDKLVCIM